MKKILLFLFVATFSLSSYSQTPLTEAVDFDVTFTDGTQFNLFDKLAEGKHVVIDWFFTTCGPCQANQPYFTEAFVNFGCNEGDVFFLSIETTVDDATTIAYEEAFAGDFAPPAASGTEGGGEDAVAFYSIGAFPTFILIAPDGEILEQDMWPLNGTTDTFTTYFEGHGLVLDPCVVNVEEASTNQLSVYPNPASENLNIDLSAFVGNVSVEVISMTGEKVFSALSNNSLEQVNVSEWATGTYMVIIRDNEQSVNRLISIAK